MKNKQITYQIAIAPSSMGCLLLQREILKTASTWVSYYFKYEQNATDNFSQMHQLDWSLSWSQAPPKELGDYFQSLYDKVRPKVHKLVFALALPAPYWFLDQSPDVGLDAAHAISSQLMHYMNSALMSNWVYDFQSYSNSKNDIDASGADQKYFLLSPWQVISNLKKWLLPFAWQWSIIDIDFCCLLRACHFYLDPVMNFSDRVVLFIDQSSEEIVLHVFNNQKYIYLFRKNINSNFNIAAFFKNKISKFFTYFQISLILFSGDQIQFDFFDNLKIPKESIFDLSENLIFPCSYLINMGLFLRPGWSSNDAF